MAEAKPPTPRLEIPDLDLPAAPSRAGASPGPGAAGPAAPRSQPRATEAAVPARGELDPDWLMQGSGVEIARSRGPGEPPSHGELDVDWITKAGTIPAGASPARSSVGELGADDFDTFTTGSRSLALEAAEPGPVEVTGIDLADPTRTRRGGPMPRGCSPEPHELSVPLSEARALAGYGDPPSMIMAVPYAVRVHLRRRILRVRLSELERQLEHAEDERDGALATLAVSLRSRLAGDERFRDLFARADGAAAAVAAERVRLAEVNAGHAEVAERLQGERGGIEQEVAARREHERSKRAALDRAEHDHKRIEARAKRLQIELRNAADAEQRARTPGSELTVSAQLAQRTAEARVELDALRLELDALRAKADAARAAADAARIELEQAEQRLGAHHRTSAAESARHAQKSGTQALSLREASRRERAALAEVMRAVFACDWGRSLEETSLALVRSHDSRVWALALEAHRHRLALEAHDRRAFRAGHVILALALVVGVVLLARLAGGG